MTSDENAVRTLLRESDIPLCRLDASELLAGGRRSRRRRRAVRMAAVVVAVVAVAVPAVVVGAGLRGPDAPVLKEPDPSVVEFAPTTTVVHHRTSVQGALSCTEKRYPVVGGDHSGVLAVDPSGRQVVGTSGGGAFLNLWTDGERHRFTIPNRRAYLSATAVTRSGAVVGTDPGEPSVNFIWRDGDLTYLKTPDGYDRAGVEYLNERGDVLGSGYRSAAFHPVALVIWPAGQPDEPRVLAEAGLHPMVLRDDGTVIASRSPDPTREGVDAIVVYRPDGTRRQIDVPADSALNYPDIGGDIVYTSVNSGPVRWNLRTGVVEVFDGLFGARLGHNSGGWFMASTTVDGRSPVLVAPDRSAFTLPFDGTINWISADGSTVIGTDDQGVVAATCSR